VGTASIDEPGALGYAVACPMHADDVVAMLSVPVGALSMEYTPNAWDTICRELDRGDAWELKRASGEG
jgi:hypothetical protein